MSVSPSTTREPSPLGPSIAICCTVLDSPNQQSQPEPGILQLSARRRNTQYTFASNAGLREMEMGELRVASRDRKSISNLAPWPCFFYCLGRTSTATEDMGPIRAKLC